MFCHTVQEQKSSHYYQNLNITPLFHQALGSRREVTSIFQHRGFWVPFVINFFSSTLFIFAKSLLKNCKGQYEQSSVITTLIWRPKTNTSVSPCLNGSIYWKMATMIERMEGGCFSFLLFSVVSELSSLCPCVEVIIIICHDPLGYFKGLLSKGSSFPLGYFHATNFE